MTESHPLTAGYPDSRYFLNTCTHRLGSFGLFHGRIGFNKANSGAPPASMPYTIVVIPDWFAFALTAMSARRVAACTGAEGRYVTPGHCASCGYDLRQLRIDAPNVERQRTSAPMPAGSNYPPRRELIHRSNCASNAIALGLKSILRTNSHASRAPCSRSIRLSSHSTLSGP